MGKHVRRRNSSIDYTREDFLKAVDEELSRMSKAQSQTAATVEITATAGVPEDLGSAYFPPQSDRWHLRQKLWLKRLQSKAPMLLFLASGTAVTIAAQVVTNLGMADSSVQVLALTKFAASLAFTYAIDFREKEPSPPPSRRCRVLMTLLGVLDCVGYATFAMGLSLCGAALSTLISAATNQLITAALSSTVLGRHLSHGQLMSLILVCGGLLVRCAGPGLEVVPSGITWPTICGCLLTLISSLAYSVMSILYEHTIRTESPAPSHNAITAEVARIGLASNLVYFLGACLPRWDELVTQHMVSSKTHPATVILALLAFAAVYNCHSWAQGLVLQSEGALGVGLVNVVRGATVTLVAGTLFCSAGQPFQCLNLSTLGSAAIISAGGLVWLASGPQEPLSQSAVKLARMASGRLRRTMSLRGDVKV